MALFDKRVLSGDVTMTDNKIILVYDFACINGGAAKVAITEAVALAERGYDVTFFSGVGPVDEKLTSTGVKVVCLEQNELKDQLGGVIGKIKGAVQGFWNTYAEKKFAELLSLYSPKDTIVHFHGWSLALSPALFSVTAKRGFKIAITTHDYEVDCPVRTYFNYHKGEMCKCTAMSLKCIITNCDKRSYAQKLYRIIRQKKLISLLRKNDVSLICLAEFNKSIIERDLKFDCKRYIVPNLIDVPPKADICPEKNEYYLFVGRFNPEKGIELFCEAVSKAGVKGIAIGDGDQIEELKKKYPNVEFCGWLTTEQMRPYIMKSRCLIVPSLCYEVGPLTVPEIQCAYALPCIVPTLCGVRENIEHSKTGYIFKSGDISELVKNIEALKDDALVHNMHENCLRASYKSQYEASNHIKTLIKCYLSILES